MKLGRIQSLFAAIAAGMIFISACTGSNSPVPTETVNPTEIQAYVNQTLAAVPTLTPLPTDTATPTLVPTVTQTPTVTLTPTVTNTPTPTATSTPAAVGPANFPANIDPLTGLAVADVSLLDRRPVMIKVANYPASGRPHAGLSFADIVFDYYIGEGANRFLALFYGQDSTKVGPIRSGRLVDAQLVPMYQGILGFEYAWAPIYERILSALGRRAFTGGPNTCPAICTDTDPPTVLSHFADTAKLTEYAAAHGVDRVRPKLDGMAFDMTAPAGGKAAQTVTVQFSFHNIGEWRYDAPSGKYLRWIENIDDKQNLTLVPLTDRITNQQLAFSNVVIVYTEYIEYASAYHDIPLVGKRGKMVLYRDGQAFEGTWYAARYDQPLQFFDANKKPLFFKNGNTWINLVGVNSLMTEPKPGTWLLKFSIP